MPVIRRGLADESMSRLFVAYKVWATRRSERARLSANVTAPAVTSRRPGPVAATINTGGIV